jgi:hypothetical protein
MGSMLSSPSKQAQQAASAEQGISNNDIASAEKYVNTQEGNLRAAIPSGASNPYLNAGASMSPSQMQYVPGSPPSPSAYGSAPSLGGPVPAGPQPGSISSISPNQIPASTGNPFTAPSPQPRMQNG